MDTIQFASSTNMQFYFNCAVLMIYLKTDFIHEL